LFLKLNFAIANLETLGMMDLEFADPFVAVCSGGEVMSQLAFSEAER
jgi:hypothetical protein